MLRYKIVRDDDPINPREWGNLGTIYYTSTRYVLGDEQVGDIQEKMIELCQDIHPDFDPENIPDYWLDEAIQGFLDKRYIILDVYAYIHSGIILSTSPFTCLWDSGQCGVIVAKKGVGGLTDEELEKRLEGEIKEFSAYMEGEVYGYEILDKDDEVVESCWGFIGYEHCKEAADEAFANLADYEKEQAEKKWSMFLPWYAHRLEGVVICQL